MQPTKTIKSSRLALQECIRATSGFTMAQYHIPGAFPDDKAEFSVPNSYQSRSTQIARPQRYATTPGFIEDVYIAVMGVTGSGKSSFIELCTQMDCGIGHGLDSRMNSYLFYLMDRLTLGRNAWSHRI